ncbi:hypothetical protein KVMX100_120214 [Klebsiella variicola]|nr:hypothetical protein KVMX100_120214 [Klebsiella variicola]
MTSFPVDLVHPDVSNVCISYMRTSHAESFSDQQIISILREAEAGVSARELCRKHAISDATFCTCLKKFGACKSPK